jgi:hypothetical protein
MPACATVITVLFFILRLSALRAEAEKSADFCC